ncbi:hypothetical protein LQW54_003000 [Pestalotiopsis sp. IQ-011]
MIMDDLNYFTCTLGESAIWKRQQPKGTKTGYQTVLELVDEKAQESSDEPALGFADFTKDPRGFTGATRILVDKTQQHKANHIVEGVSFQPIPDYDADIDTAPKGEQHAPQSDIAYLRHTSGTSSGLPKPIVQRHWGAVGVLARLTGHEHSATFTTTPLYHGGLADCFRAWTGGAMIWLFPEGVAPVTETNVMKAVEISRQNSPAGVGVEYFTGVPYVLQSLAGDPDGLRLLKDMGLVGVGGAALAAAVGDRLVQQGVRLVSRMGSAECGFLMSSHRDYDADGEWQYLRAVSDERLLSFEPRDGGLFELVAKPGWPLRAKQNRDDGSYATADLFQPHERIPGAWRYHSRSDAQITLANGKKFDPAPLEAAIVAGAHHLQDMLVVGTGRDYAGALLFPKSGHSSEEQIMEDVWPVIEHVNKESQSHSRLTRTALVVVPRKGSQVALEKSSKGTVMRRQAEERYAGLIEAIYDSAKDGNYHDGPIRNEELCDLINDTFSQVIGRPIDPSQDVFRQGVDSIACIQVRKLIENNLLPPGSTPLPLNIIYEKQTIQSLSRYIQGVRRGTGTVDSLENGALDESELEQMTRLAKLYSDFESASVMPIKPQKEAAQHGVVLTGATGALGAHILHYLRMSPSDCSVFIHAAWTVNFSLRLGSFEDHIQGLHHMIRYAVSIGSNYVFVSSTASVTGSSEQRILERITSNPSDAAPLGYSRSKWVAEQICSAANQHCEDKAGGQHPQVSVVRVGQLCGNATGAWNASEAYPLMLSTAKITGRLPDLQGESLNWLPVDQAAQAILEISSNVETRRAGKSNGESPVYHVLNPHRRPTWHQMLEWLQENGSRPCFEVVSPREWTGRLEKTLEGSATGHPAQKLLGFWQQKYDRGGQSTNGATPKPPPIFDIGNSTRVSESMAHVDPLQQEQLFKMWDWIQSQIT